MHPENVQIAIEQASEMIGLLTQSETHLNAAHADH
jgi:hypothetical protein